MRCVLCVRVVVIVVLVVVVSRQLPDFQTMIEFRRLYCMVVFIIIIILVELICSNNYTFIGSTPPNPRYSLDTGGEHEIQTMHVKKAIVVKEELNESGKIFEHNIQKKFKISALLEMETVARDGGG